MSLYYAFESKPSIKMSDSQYDGSKDAEKLHEALTGIGTDEKAIIDTIAKKTTEQKIAIVDTFKTLYGKDLLECISDDLSGDFKNAVVAMLTPLPMFYVKELHDAVVTKFSATILGEILSTLSNRTLKDILALYHKTYGTSFEEDIKKNTSGDGKHLFVALANANRSENPKIDKDAAFEDSKGLFEAGENRWGTDESKFICILAQRSFPQLRAVFQEYEELMGTTMERTIQSETSGSLAKGLVAIVLCAKNRAEYFAQRMEDAMKGFGTNEKTLTRIVVGRAEIDLDDIKEAYENMYGISLVDRVAEETSGSYRDLLVAIMSD